VSTLLSIGKLQVSPPEPVATSSCSLATSLPMHNGVVSQMRALWPFQLFESPGPGGVRCPG
jgi:hypothetical protein